MSDVQVDLRPGFLAWAVVATYTGGPHEEYVADALIYYTRMRQLRPSHWRWSIRL